MSVILAAIDDSDAAASVLTSAQAMAELLGCSLRAVHVREGAADVAATAAAAAGVPVEIVDGEPTEAISAAVGDPEVIVVVLGARGAPVGPRPCGHVAMSVVERAGKPVLVVPPSTTRDPGAPIRRVLVPLEGTEASTAAVAEHLREVGAAGVELVAVHVFDADTVPRFWDQASYAAESFAAEFASRWCTEDEMDLRLRRGEPAEAVIDVAADEGSDLIALGWSQSLATGRAAVVRAVLERTGIPVLLLPVPDIAEI